MLLTRAATARRTIRNHSEPHGFTDGCSGRLDEVRAFVLRRDRETGGTRYRYGLYPYLGLLLSFTGQDHDRGAHMRPRERARFELDPCVRVRHEAILLT